MLRRLSSQFRKDKKKEKGQLNGFTPNEKNEQRSSKPMVNGVKKEEQPDHSETRGEVSDVFEQFAQLIHASQRPLPTQSGNGSYIEHEVPSGMFADLRSMGFKDVKTLKDVMQNNASGELADDKTYLMERVIQVIVKQLCMQVVLGLLRRQHAVELLSAVHATPQELLALQLLLICNATALNLLRPSTSNATRVHVVNRILRL